MRIVRVALAAGVFTAALVVGATARADVSTTNPAGLVVFPGIFVFQTVDTEIQLSNTSPDPIHVRCYLVNANAHCSNSPTTVCDDTSGRGCEGGFCLPGWTETDFRFTLTKFQPIVWRISQGLPFFPIDGLNHTTQDGQYNADSSIPPAPEFPFQGELKCFQVNENEEPVARNDLKGEATLVIFDEGEVDAAEYNAVGIQATDFNDGNDTLCLGGTEPTEECPQPEYNGCPAVLILDHFFDFAPEPVNGDFVVTFLNLVPCSEDFLTQTNVKTTLQFLVFNEFEQRFSTSRRVDCFFFTQLADIDTRPEGFEGGGNAVRAFSGKGAPSDDDTSIFSVFVEGTLTGQTRIRPVQTGETNVGHGQVGMALEFQIARDVGQYTSAFQLDQAGTRTQGDIIRAPRQ